MAVGSNNPFPSVLLDEQASAPTTPAAGFVRAYRKADGIYYVDSTGTEHGPLIESIVAGTNVTVDVTDPANPVVSATGGGSSGYSLIDEDTVTVTSGAITLNQTAVTNLAATQITLAGAAAGDIVYYHLSALISSAASTKGFDAYTYVGGTRTNPFGPGVDASLATLGGVQAWFRGSGGAEFGLGGFARRVLVSGDISAGNVTVGIAYAGTNATARTLYASGANPIQAIAQLWRP